VVGEGDSIVGVFGMKDKMQMHRELDSLDIVNTVNVDTNLEKERNDASMATTELLLTGIHKIEPCHNKTNIVRLRPAWIQTSLRIRAV
jgi:hypothetical protein